MKNQRGEKLSLQKIYKEKIDHEKNRGKVNMTKMKQENIDNEKEIEGS